jgi:hypothetical protein
MVPRRSRWAGSRTARRAAASAAERRRPDGVPIRARHPPCGPRVAPAWTRSARAPAGCGGGCSEQPRARWPPAKHQRPARHPPRRAAHGAGWRWALPGACHRGHPMRAPGVANRRVPAWVAEAPAAADRTGWLGRSSGWTGAQSPGSRFERGTRDCAYTRRASFLLPAGRRKFGPRRGTRGLRRPWTLQRGPADAILPRVRWSRSSSSTRRRRPSTASAVG